MEDAIAFAAFATLTFFIIFSYNRGRVIRRTNKDEEEEEEVRLLKNEKEKYLRDEDRKNQEGREKSEAVLAMEEYLGATAQFHYCPDIGSRLQKYWACGRVLITLAPLSKSCLLELNKENLDELNKLLHHLRHPHLVPVLRIRYDNSHVIMTMFKQTCSLRDYIYHQSDPLVDWAEKYHPEQGEAIPSREVASCGRQILEAIKYLYDEGLPPIGHVQTGNIFVNITRGEIGSSGRRGNIHEESGDAGDEEQPANKIICRLGGYENTLLGYKSRLYHSIAEKERIDIIQFGHVIYEMAYGHEFEGSSSFSQGVQSYSEDQKEWGKIVQTILELKGDPRANVKEMLSWELFTGAELPSKVTSRGNPLPGDVRKFLSIYRKRDGVSVRGVKGVVHKYVDEFRKMKHFLF